MPNESLMGEVQLEVGRCGRNLGFLRRARPGITSGVAGVNQKSHQVNGKCLETVAGTQS